MTSSVLAFQPQCRRRAVPAIRSLAVNVATATLEEACSCCGAIPVSCVSGNNIKADATAVTSATFRTAPHGAGISCGGHCKVSNKQRTDRLGSWSF